MLTAFLAAAIGAAHVELVIQTLRFVAHVVLRCRSNTSFELTAAPQLNSRVMPQMWRHASVVEHQFQPHHCSLKLSYPRLVVFLSYCAALR
jgi:hypothetical protein